MARRLGWLGPAIVGLGVVVAAVGVWFMITSKPTAGDVIDTFQVDPHTSLVIRAEQGGDRAFVELRSDDKVIWQALVPPYAGRKGNPGISWSPIAVAVRVIRDHKAELFALSMRDASKLGGIHLGKEHGPIAPSSDVPLTLTDHIRSYEFVAGPDWHQLDAIDLNLGKPVWTRELGPQPIEAAALEGGLLWVQQGGVKRHFQVLTGIEDATMIPLPNQK